MTKCNDSAYPHGYDNCYIGLNKREFFAIMALQGILANSELLRNHQDIDLHILAVKNADDLIAELNKQP